MTVVRLKRVTVGVVAVVFGVAGVVIPVVPGWPFFVFAVFVLSRDLPFMRPARAWLAAKHPAIADGIGHWEIRLGLLSPEERAAVERHRFSLKPEG